MKESKKQISHLRMLITDLIMGFLFLLLFGFVLWLIWITYFREYFDTGIIERSRLKTIEHMTVAGMDKKQHFHNLDESVTKIANSPSVCMKCHGSYSHSKSKQIRAFLNAHAYFMACEVCHLKESKRPTASFRWLDDLTGDILRSYPTKYRAKIVPIEIAGSDYKRLDESSDREFVEEFLQLRDTLDADQEATAKIRIHRNVSDNAIVCEDCHTSDKESYLPYRKLNYSQQRIVDIVGTEVVGMLKKYKKFHIPSLIRENRF